MDEKTLVSKIRDDISKVLGEVPDIDENLLFS